METIKMKDALVQVLDIETGIITIVQAGDIEVTPFGGVQQRGVYCAIVGHLWAKIPGTISGGKSTYRCTICSATTRF